MRRASAAIVVLTGLVCMLVGAFLDRRGLGGWDLGTDLDRLTAGTSAVIAAAGLLSLAAARNARVLAAICAAAVVVPGALAVTGAVESGLPGPSTGVLGVGSAVVVLGTVARAFEREGTTGGAHRPRAAVVAVVAVACTALAAWAAAGVVVDAPVRSSTAVTADAPPDAQRADGVRWEWDADGPVRDVRAAGTGVVVAGTDGVTALDGASGAPRWEFARTGARVADLVVSPDRRSVVVVHEGAASRVAVVTVLDALTGARRWESALDRRPDLLVTDTVVALAGYERPDDDADDRQPLRARLAARDLTTGSAVWTWESPQGCGTSLVRSLAAVRAVPIETECPDGATLHGVDERTGQDAWSLAVRPFSAAVSDYPVRASDGGGLVVTAGAGTSHVVVEAATGLVVGRLDTEAFPLPAPDGRVQLLDGDPERVVAAVDGSGALVTVPPGCDREAAVAVTGAAVLRLCRTERHLELQVDGGAAVPLDLLPGDQFAGIDLLRDAFVVPAPGAVVVAVASSRGTVLGLA
ncbi:PQQ-binding-like beta-propeller repeat protein [Pseudonocardia cypriaca]|uniref:Putative pyrroloquinoline-quinone binding quinoprotein n=1 Tax=Pseudonocardia cypriaca TaxID=882449 RepID=A0A543GGD2_9PSEU|nr:PQQ-binding-like beta-propeller repeat protein [Pseudonocardia cypriaca]TQM45117.1 putative pyrroloquinoline-quinone binding quinoprotein [Pseudonocardia cypriaca]